MQFLGEMVHPIVRTDPDERQAFIELFNRHHTPEGWEIAEVSRVAEAKDLAQTLRDYVARQVTRMETALSGDLELAIGTAKEPLGTPERLRHRARERGEPHRT